MLIWRKGNVIKLRRVGQPRMFTRIHTAGAFGYAGPDLWTVNAPLWLNLMTLGARLAITRTCVTIALRAKVRTLTSSFLVQHARTFHAKMPRALRENLKIFAPLRETFSYFWLDSATAPPGYGESI